MPLKILCLFSGNFLHKKSFLLLLWLTPLFLTASNTDENIQKAQEWCCNHCGIICDTQEEYITHTLSLLLPCPSTCPTCKNSLVESPRRSIKQRCNHIQKHFCEICHRFFDYISNKKRHHRVHTGEKPYSCEFCDQTFNNSSNRYKHQRNSHPQLPLAGATPDQEVTSAEEPFSSTDLYFPHVSPYNKGASEIPDS
jgi:hypothetical protein